MTKSAFAEHIGVSPARISQMIKEGIIGADALVGEGRAARIESDLAKSQIAERRHVGQALGNGLTTRLGAEGSAQAPLPNLGERLPTTQEQIAIERLEQERRKNRQAAIDEKVANGSLIAVEDFEREIGRIGQDLVNEFTGMIPDIANAIAAKFEVPQRDVMHVVRQVMTDKRRKSAEKKQAKAAQLPETVDATVDIA